MISLLRSSRFMAPDRSRKVFLDMRRLMDEAALIGSSKTKQFQVMTRSSNPHIMLIKWFNTKPEARAFWCERAMVLEDQGLQRMDFHIMGFHEED